MPTFISPTATDVSPVGAGNDPASRRARRLLAHYASGDRGRHVIKTAGVYTTTDVLTPDDIAAADVIAWPDGSKGPAVFLGGHRTEVTASEATALSNAGYTIV